MLKKRCFIALTSLLLILSFLTPGFVSAATDKTQPTISGASNTTAYLNHSFDPRKGVTAKDNVDGNITDLIKISGKVNTKKVGKYTLTYKVTDSAKNTRTVKRVVTVKKDTTKPKITGASNKTVYKGYSFNPKTGVQATDNADGNITSKIKVSGKVNTQKVGKYIIKYTVTDKTKNKTTVNRTITVKNDTTKPKITGASNKTVYKGYSFNPKTGVKATDNVDGDITNKIKISGNVKTNEVGTYKLKYSVQDKTKNTTTITRTIKVIKDTTKPKITGASNKTINYGDSFNPKTGVVATDNVDGTITNKLTISGSVDRYKVGTYTLTYTVKDKTGNTTKVTRTVKVVDKVAPTLSGYGLKDKSINMGDTFNPLHQVYANDKVDGNLTAAIKVEGTVNVNKAGIYTLTYSVKDKSGNTAKAERKITVVDNVAPILKVPGDTHVQFFDEFDPMKGVNATDNNDGNLTSKVKVEGTVDTSDLKAGQFRNLTYTVSDKAGNTTTVKRLVVVDFREAVFSGMDSVTIGLGEKFDPLDGVKVIDKESGKDITTHITIKNNVNVNKVGAYEVHYYLPREKGYDTDVRFYTRHITVYDNIPPVIKGVKAQTITTVVGQEVWPDVLEGVTAEDNIDGDLTNRIYYEAVDYDPTRSGKYQFKIKVYDNSGNIAEETCIVTLIVNKIPVSSITVGSALGDELITNIEEPFYLYATVMPENATVQNVTWKSSDESIATVDENGVATGKKEGTVTFTATGDGGVTGSITIEFINKPELRFDEHRYNDDSLDSLLFSLVNYDDIPAYVDTVKLNNCFGQVVQTYTKEQLQEMGVKTIIQPSEKMSIVLDISEEEPFTITAGGTFVVSAGPKDGNTYDYICELQF